MTHKETQLPQPEPFAAAAMRLFCRAMWLDVDDLTTESVHMPDEMTIGDEINVSVRCKGHDCRSGVGAQMFVDTIELPLVLMADSENDSGLYFQVVSRVIHFQLDHVVGTACWGAESGGGTRAWAMLSDERYTDHWRTCSDREDKEPEMVAMSFASDDSKKPLHPLAT